MVSPKSDRYRRDPDSVVVSYKQLGDTLTLTIMSTYRNVLQKRITGSGSEFACSQRRVGAP